MEPEYDVFISYAHQDGRRFALSWLRFARKELRVFIDETEVGTVPLDSGAPWQRGIAKSKVLLAWYSDAYARSRACQWELSAAYLCGSG